MLGQIGPSCRYGLRKTQGRSQSQERRNSQNASSPHRGRGQASTFVKRGRVVQVAETSGISENERVRLFRHFYQLETQPNDPGRGLGLRAIVGQRRAASCCSNSLAISPVHGSRSGSLLHEKMGSRARITRRGRSARHSFLRDQRGFLRRAIRWSDSKALDRRCTFDASRRPE